MESGSPTGDVRGAHRRLTRGVIDLPGVSGTAVGMMRGRPCLTVYVEQKDRALMRRIPQEVEGFPVRVEVSGRFRRES